MQLSFTQLAIKPNRAVLALIFAGAIQLNASAVMAANFTIDAANSTTAQTLVAGQTGTVAAGRSLKVSGSTVAVTISGNNATLINQGTISQTGTGRVIRDNVGVTGLMIINGSITNSTALMQSADADVVQMNVSNGSVTLNNYGSMISLNASKGGSQVVDFNAILSGSNIVNNYAGALMQAYEADAVRPGVNGVVNNAGTIQSITTTGSSSDGIDAQNNSGITVNNLSTGVIDGARHGITGGALNSTSSFTMTVNNSAGGIIRGENGAGLNLDGFNANQVVTVVNAGLITGNGVTGDGDGVDVDGLVNITNTGIIRSINAYSAPSAGLAYSEGISVGGGTIINSGAIEGLVATGNTNAVGRGITLAGNDITSGSLAGTREAIYGNATITNQAGGLIRGESDSAIVAVGAASQYTITINNNAGAVILGGGVSNAAIQTGLNNAVINNAGTINGASSGKAITFAGLSNALYITGGSASVIGNISGALGGSNTMVINPGTGNSFAYADSVSNFNSVEVKSGSVTLSGVNTYSGKTIVSGGTLTLDGANRISSSSALELNGGTLTIANVNTANGQTFASLSLTDNSTLNLGDTSITFNALGDMVSGKTLTITNYLTSASPNYAFRVLGNFSTDASFQSLISSTTINGVAAKLQFDGVYTNVAAVPEPETYAMFIFGMGLMGLVARRRKQEEIISGGCPEFCVNGV